jgi:hypothetical protein
LGRGRFGVGLTSLGGERVAWRLSLELEEMDCRWRLCVYIYRYIYVCVCADFCRINWLILFSSLSNSIDCKFADHGFSSRALLVEDSYPSPLPRTSRVPNSTCLRSAGNRPEGCPPASLSWSASIGSPGAVDRTLALEKLVLDLEVHRGRPVGYRHDLSDLLEQDFLVSIKSLAF